MQCLALLTNHQRTLRALLGGLALLASAAVVHATTTTVNPGDPPWVTTPGTYAFSGTCLDCPEPQGATATLTYSIVQYSGYTLPEVTFTYHSSLFDLQSEWVEVYKLDIGALPGPAAANILFGAEVDGEQHTFSFLSDAQGNWLLDDQFVLPTLHNDIGSGGQWLAATAVPEPATALLAALGLLAAAKRRRR